MNICIFCSAFVVDEKYTKPTKELCRLLARSGHHLVWGGSNTGMMLVIADTFRENGGKLYGMALEAYKHKMYKDADEMVISKDLGTRKAAMLAKSDVILVLPGGIGTLDELTEVLELKKQCHHSKPIVILNIDGFYDGFFAQLARIEKEGFTPISFNKLTYCTESPKDVEAYIDKLP